MPKNRTRPVQARGRQTSESRAPDGWFLLFPALVAVILNIPSLSLGYLWDDFYFLTSHDAQAHLLPDSGATFYRPIPLGLYFRALHFLDPAGGTLGHVLNLAAVVGVVILLVLLVSDLCGRRAGFLAGLLFAGYGQVSSLVAWISASQDLFAILFLVASLLLRHKGRDVPALACAAAALLCKETALAAFPVLLLWDHLVGRPARNLKIQLVGYALVAIAWAVVHPGVRQLVAGGGTSIGYVGVQHSGGWAPKLGRYLAALVNLPPWGLTATWREDLVGYGIAAVAAMFVGLGIWDRQRRGTIGEPISLGRVGLISALLALPSLLMPVALVRYAAPHLTCMAALGVAMFLGAVLATQRRLVVGVALAAFVLLGIRSRGVRPEGDWIASEPAMIEASNAVREVRANFQKLLPTIPKGGQVVLSLGPIGRGVQMALIDGQALSLWYRDPSLQTTMIRGRRADAPAEFLVRVTNGLDVLAIDPDRLVIRSAAGAEPDLREYHQPVINYARAVAAAGNVDRAIQILERLNGVEPNDLIAYNRHLIASMLLASGRRAEADSVLRATESIAKDVALPLVAQLQADASPGDRLDDAAFEAFGLSSQDPETIRWVMRDLQRRGSPAQAAWFALRLKRAAPGDSEAAEMLRKAAQSGVQPQRMPGRLERLAL
jgi:hypothetical protein